MTGSRRRDTPSVDGSEPGKDGRISWTAKRAAVARLHALSGGTGTPLGSHVRTVAEQHGVNVRTVYKWLKDPDLLLPDSAGPTRGRFEVTLEHLVVVAQEQNAFDAHARLTKAGAISCSYPTFARALQKRTDPALVAAALNGHKGLVNNRLYLAYNPPHRNHTWHLDHTPMDLWVWPSHKERLPIRPQVTAVVDGATGLVLAMVPWKTDVNQEMVAAALAEAAVLRDYEGVLVGGVPEQIVCDNAAQHFAPVMREAAERLGWIIAPTAAYSSWQNGKAERVMGLINKKFADRMPGASKAGTTRDGSPRFVQRLPVNVKPEDVLSWEAFRALLEAYRQDLNRTIKVRRLGKQTRLQAWSADPTELRRLDPDILRTAMLRTAHLNYAASKNGIRFRNQDYVGVGLRIGHRYEVRYLEGNTDFIEVFTLNQEYVTRAEDARRMSTDRRAAFMAERARQEQAAAAITAGVQQHRQHLAAAANNLFGHEDTTWDGSADLEAVIDGESRVIDRVDAQAQPTHRPRGGRPALPRATPQVIEEGSDDTTARQTASERLAARFGAGLPDSPSAADVTADKKEKEQ